MRGKQRTWRRATRRLNQEVAADRGANGGKLTGAEKAQVNKRENAIYI